MVNQPLLSMILSHIYDSSLKTPHMEVSMWP